MNPENFEQIWNLILNAQGRVFHTITGLAYTYEVNGNKIQIIGNRPYNLPMQNFLNALPHFDPNDLGATPKAIRGRSYVWGIYNGLFQQIQQLQ